MIQTHTGTERSFTPCDPYRGGYIAPTADVSTSVSSHLSVAVASQHTFRLARTPYLGILLRSLFLLSAFLTGTLLSAILGVWLWSTYSHIFVPYLKWQDALVASFEYLALVSLLGGIMVLRFLVALHAGYWRSMLNVVDFHTCVASTISVRDLSHKNLSGITRAICTNYCCFFVVLVALLPEMLIDWTLHLPSTALVIFTTAVVIILSIAALMVALPSFSFIIIAWIGSISFTRKLGASHTYKLTSSTTLRVSDLELIVTYPDAPEAVIDLNLFKAEDQPRLLWLLQKHWLDAKCVWNLQLDEEM